MPTKTRFVSYFEIETSFFGGQEIIKNFNFYDDFKKLTNYISGLNIFDKRIDNTKKKKIVFLNHVEIEENNKIISLEFQSAKYDYVRNVIDTENMTSRGTLKRRQDGDLESTYLSIHFEDENSATCILEDNYVGITIGKIGGYLNDMLANYYKSIDFKRFYKLDFSIIPSEAFLVALSKMTRISSMKFVVDAKELKGSEFADAAGRKDLRDEVDLVFKPLYRESIMKKTIEDYYEKKGKNKRIKRITVKGDANENPVTLDTEKMKKRISITVETDVTNVVVRESIIAEFKKLLLE